MKRRCFGVPPFFLRNSLKPADPGYDPPQGEILATDYDSSLIDRGETEDKVRGREAAEFASLVVVQVASTFPHFAK